MLKHVSHTPMCLLSLCLSHTHTYIRTHARTPAHIPASPCVKQIPSFPSSVALSRAGSSIYFFTEGSSIRCLALRVGPSRAAPAVPTHCFSLHPGPLWAILQSTVFGQGSYSLSYPEGEQRKSQGVLTVLQGAPPALGLLRVPGPRWGGIRESTDRWEGPGWGHRHGCVRCGGRGNSLSVASQKLLSQEQAGLLVSGREGHYFRGVFSDFGMLLICYMKKAGHNESYSLVNMYILIIYNRRNARMKTVRVILSLSGGVYK
ncbi:hypothetical protein mRhiFer1_009901 [Rhinolophus ferrumequinum]|uniref:Uncharacterized protein n=1 Tax=Rhinolophus ferrumequinum TaxID=59479 RepID=A0A7J7YI10_RHIFE|nr:hypothetical protein mRhiFer1_009901 [Rhinolophus ferrumequinum]